MDEIWVDRDGTRYGPYAPEEFLAYLASGHIVASDRARIGERGDFEPAPILAARLGAAAAAAPSPIAGLRSAAAAAVRQQPGPTPGQAAVAPMSGTAARLPPPAGFWRRAGAYAIDAVLVVVILVLLSLLASGAFTGSPPGEMKRGLVRVISALDGRVLAFGWLVGWPLYFALLESSPWQATPGKRVLGLVVTDRDGARPGFGRALGRHLAALANYLSLLVGWLLVALDRDKRGLHDHIAGTRVLSLRQPPVSAWLGFAACLAGLLALAVFVAVLLAGLG
jgi:uncharacterized RDD family membrane protein YckC